MAIWIQSLSWTLIYALGQGFVVFLSLRILLKLIPEVSSNIKYHLSLSAMTILPVWFMITWWQQYHLLVRLNEQLTAGYTAGSQNILQQLHAINIIDGEVGHKSWLLFSGQIIPWIAGCYVAGLLFMLLRLSAGTLELFSLRRDGLTKVEPRYEAILSALQHKINFNGGVQLFISAKAHVPMVVGFFKPMILMPAATMAQLSVAQLESILLHELAHIQRNDYLVNILQTVVETMLFFNPFVWMISAIIRREREHCCDDLVLDHTGAPLSYASALAALATETGGATAYAVAASGQKNHLFHRIKRIVEMKKNPFSYSRMVAAILIIVSITCSIVWITPSFAKAKNTKSKKTVVKQVKVEQAATATDTDANDPDVSETALLVRRLGAAGLISEVKGFILEKKKDKLYVDEQQLADDAAAKYLTGIKQEYIRVQVFSFSERQRMHPDANLLQLIMPVSFKAGCVDNSSTKKKKGC